jgi:hypothetical protein
MVLLYYRNIHTERGITDAAARIYTSETKFASSARLHAYGNRDRPRRQGIILGAIWGAASTVYANKQTTSALQEVLASGANVRGLYANGQIPGGAQALSPMLINAGQVPSNMIGSCAGSMYGAGYGGTAGCIFTPWNTQVIVWTQMGWGGAVAALQRTGLIAPSG